MDWLKRNESILEELQKQPLQKVALIGKSIGRAAGYAEIKKEIYHLGTLESNIVGSEIPIAGKFPVGRWKERVSFGADMKFINAIQTEYPHLLPLLPAFYGLIVTPSGPVGYITEDFSNRGRTPVKELFRMDGSTDNLVPEEITTLTEEHEFRAKLFFKVNEQLRIGDIDAPGLSFQKMIKYRLDLQPHTITLDYEL